MDVDALHLGPWELRVDRAATQSAYAKTSDFTPCDCLDCENYHAALDRAPEAMLDLLAALGVDPQKIPEVYVFDGPKEGSVRYWGWYHFVGQITAGPRAKPSDEDFRHAPIASGLEIAVHEAAVLRLSGFQEMPAVLQLEFGVDLPWVVAKAPPS